jgi:UDP:flavonoid glycosyltransferase YjiC (YdhE family)
MSEAVYLGKPLLSVPIAGQFEQIMNARWLAHLGDGRCAESLDAGALREFLADLPAMEDALGDYLQFGNEATFSAIDELLERGPEALALPG